jgi:hypothetical protein
LHFFFDESGDYAFPEDRFDCYVQAALICPDSVLPDLENFVDDRKASWEADELHAAELDIEQLIEVRRSSGGAPATWSRTSPTQCS